MLNALEKLSRHVCQTVTPNKVWARELEWLGKIEKFSKDSVLDYFLNILKFLFSCISHMEVMDTSSFGNYILA